MNTATAASAEPMQQTSDDVDMESLMQALANYDRHSGKIGPYEQIPEQQTSTNTAETASALAVQPEQGTQSEIVAEPVAAESVSSVPETPRSGTSEPTIDGDTECTSVSVHCGFLKRKACENAGPDPKRGRSSSSAQDHSFLEKRSDHREEPPSLRPPISTPGRGTAGKAVHFADSENTGPDRLKPRRSPRLSSPSGARGRIRDAASSATARLEIAQDTALVTAATGLGHEDEDEDERESRTSVDAIAITLSPNRGVDAEGEDSSEEEEQVELDGRAVSEAVSAASGAEGEPADEDEASSEDDDSEDDGADTIVVPTTTAAASGADGEPVDEDEASSEDDDGEDDEEQNDDADTIVVSSTTAAKSKRNCFDDCTAVKTTPNFKEILPHEWFSTTKRISQSSELLKSFSASIKRIRARAEQLSLRIRPDPLYCLVGYGRTCPTVQQLEDIQRLQSGWFQLTQRTHATSSQPSPPLEGLTGALCGPNTQPREQALSSCQRHYSKITRHLERSTVEFFQYRHSLVPYYEEYMTLLDAYRRSPVLKERGTTSDDQARRDLFAAIYPSQPLQDLNSKCRGRKPSHFWLDFTRNLQLAERLYNITRGPLNIDLAIALTLNLTDAVITKLNLAQARLLPFALLEVPKVHILNEQCIGWNQPLGAAATDSPCPRITTLSSFELQRMAETSDISHFKDKLGRVDLAS